MARLVENPSGLLNILCYLIFPNEQLLQIIKKPLKLDFLEQRIPKFQDFSIYCNCPLKNKLK